MQRLLDFVQPKSANTTKSKWAYSGGETICVLYMSYYDVHHNQCLVKKNKFLGLELSQGLFMCGKNVTAEY